MVDAIISAVVEDLNSMLLSSIKEEVKLVTGVNNEVKKLVSNLKSIQALLDDAEERQLKEASVKNWLFNLKSVSYDMDDVLDEWNTRIQTSQLQHQQHKVLSIFCCICFTVRDVGLRHVVARKIREIQQRLHDIAKDEVMNQLIPSQKTAKYIERPPTTRFIDMQTVKGRDEEKDKVKSMILEDKSKFLIISLLGMGGIGKTTLAQLVYNDMEIKTHFDKRIWVCVSEPFDEIRIANAILKCIDSSITVDLKELENVLEKIHAILCEKKFLLVLDDVWNENPTKWKDLKQSLMCGLSGSTILITTRKLKVALVMGCRDENIHRVGLLSSEQCWSIISQIALVQGDPQKLESIGRRIADKCKGLPLVATTVGGVLRDKKFEKDWLRVLEKKEWEGNDVLDPLKLSYYDLPLSLKQCFKYCAIFPKDSEISKKRLIGMWMAQGYLKREEKDEDLEIIGETYFDNLIARSLFQIYSDSGCVLHDMVSDLAQTFTKGECLMIEVLNDMELNGNSLYADANVRHLTLMIENEALFPKYIYGFTKLRSLIIQLRRYRSSLTVDAVKDIFNYLTCLRTLDLSKCGIEEIPSSIKKLVHLRWLDLSDNSNLKTLPETLCECYNLQALILDRCWNIVNLPKRIGKLINLMYLEIESCFKIKYLPKGIGNLWRLKELFVFIVSVNKDESSSIVEMENLNNLQGRLEIRGLGNVRKTEDAKKAQLMKKKNVTNFRLSFDGNNVQEDEEELLEALELPSDLEQLYITEYKGKTLFPSWMMKLNLLRMLEITACENCEELPPLGKLSCLEELKLRVMRVKRVGVEFMGIEKEKDASTSFLSFPKLKTLVFSGFTEWEEWDDIDEWLMERINNKTITVMPCLQKLIIGQCPKLKILSPKWMMMLNVLRVMEIYGCENWEEVPPLGKLPCLEELNLYNMGVKRVGVEFMGIEKEKDASTSFLSFPKLKILSFEFFSEWEEWDDIDEWLMERINNKTITVMPCLQTLKIYNCPKLKTLPYQLLSPLITTRLQELDIDWCDVLQQEVQKDKLSHIPRLKISPGRLKISGLGLVRQREEAKKAQLMKKKNVINLSLSFNRFHLLKDEEETFEGDNEMKDEEELLEALEPPSDLEDLSIWEYKGKTLFPSWMMKLDKLRELHISECRNCEELPPLEKLPFLEKLYFYDMKVKRVGVEFMGIEKEKDASTSFLSFPKLKMLRFSVFPKWEEWDDIDEWLMERINNKTITIMSYLEYIYIRECRKLKTLSYQLLSPPITTRLQELDIDWCDVLQQEVQKDKLSHIPRLKISPGYVRRREEEEA